MINNLQPRKKQNYNTLVIHSTDISFGFGFRKNNDAETDELFIKDGKFSRTEYEKLLINPITFAAADVETAVFSGKMTT